MKPWKTMWAGAICAVLLASCGRKMTAGTPISGPPKVGATYSLIDGEGGFRVAKILAVEEDVVFVSLYGNRWTARPVRMATTQAGPPAPIAFSSQSFTGLQPVELKDGEVSAEELEAYEKWKLTRQEPF